MNESTGKKCEKLSLKLSKDLSNKLWLVNKAEGKVGGATKKRKTNIEAAPNTKQSYKVSLPIEIFWSAMPNLKVPESKIPDLSRGSRIETPRPLPPPPPPPPVQMMRPPAPGNTTRLRMLRHPVPTNKVRTTMADKLEKIVKSTPTKESVQNNVAESGISPVILHSPFSRATEVLSAKHKLPVVIPFSKNSSIMSNPVYKHHLNDYCTAPRTISTAVAASQTERIFIVTEQDFKTLQRVQYKNIIESDIQILDAVKDSGVTKEELQKQLDKIKKRRESNNDSECIVIDVESESEKRSEKDDNTLSKAIRHSEQNKNYLLTLRSLLPLSKGCFAATPAQPLLQPGNFSPKTVASNELTRSIPAAPTLAVEPIQATASASETPNDFSSFHNIVEYDDISNSPTPRTPTRIASDEMLGGLAIAPTAIQTPSPGIAAPNPPVVNDLFYNNTTGLQKSNIRSNNVEPTLISSEDANTQREDENNNKHTQTCNNKTAKLDTQRDNVIPRYGQNNLQYPSFTTVAARTIVQEQQKNVPTSQRQELPMFQTPQIPVQIQHPQMQLYAAPGHHERPHHYVSPRSRKMQQQRNQYAQMRQQFPYPYVQNRPIALPTPHIQQPHAPPVQLYPNNNPRQFLPGHNMPIGGFSRLSRVMSTDEANLHGQVVQHGRNYYPVDYDRYGNRWPKSLPDSRHSY